MARSTRARVGLSRGFWSSLLVATSLLTLLFLAAEIRLLRLPFQRDYGEGHVLWMATQVLDSHTAYRPLDQLPYVVDPYPPGYLVAVRFAGVLTHNLLTAGRSLSLLSTAAAGIAIGLTILFSASIRFPLRARLAAAAYGGAVALLNDNVATWASLMRVDMLALFLMYAGLAVYIVLGRRERWQYVAGALFLLAFLTKQTMLSAPGACAVFGLLTEARRTIRVFGCTALAGLAAVIALNTVTQGGFLLHVVGYNLNPYSWQSALDPIYSNIRSGLPALILAATAVVAVLHPLRFLRVRCERPCVRAVLLGGGNAVLAGFAMLSKGKVGAGLNHFLAWDMSIGLLAGLFLLGFLATRKIGPGRNRVTFPVIALLFAALIPSTILLHAVGPGSMIAAGIRNDAELVRLLRATPGPVFSENLLALEQAGKNVEVEPATLSFLANSGRWDERPYTGLFDRRYFSLLVTYDIHNRERYTPAVTSAIERGYVSRERIGSYILYRPMGTAARP